MYIYIYTCYRSIISNKYNDLIISTLLFINVKHKLIFEE